MLTPVPIPTPNVLPIAKELVTTVMAQRRKLLAKEKQLFPASFKETININNVTLIYRAHNPFASGKILTRNDKIFWPECPDDFTKTSTEYQSVLMHELCHVWQYHTNKLSAAGYIMKPKRWFYEYVFDADKTFDDYPTEKQADLLQDWYLVNNGVPAENYNKDKSVRPTKEQLNKTVPFIWS